MTKIIKNNNNKIRGLNDNNNKNNNNKIRGMLSYVLNDKNNKNNNNKIRGLNDKKNKK